ncbi:hypothetical protein JHN59_37115 [Streptomyces sp. MBT49]|uniref:hypothetical protein n=1 Tax=unclassified Streptomyces TaxID=2593676 RepID=UPI00190B70FA|nr:MULTISPECIES: hypothetical protein [unclassified Streptomyces]MBK3630322.1 hypothetical protein [Streptomyces sp. MBT49]MBK3634709.1 hypothetical protein [Streptomyces sp. MBT97]
MAQQSTDPRPAEGQDVTGEQRRTVAQTLASIAERYAAEEPGALVDEFEFVMRVGTDAYAISGLGVQGGLKLTAGLVRELAGDVTVMTRGHLSARLRDLVAEWDDNAPAIPRHPVPGPRKSDESGTVPAPRRGGLTEVGR